MYRLILVCALLTTACGCGGGSGDDDDSSNHEPGVDGGVDGGADGGGDLDGSGDDSSVVPTPLDCDDITPVAGQPVLEYQEIVDGLNFPGAVEFAQGDARPYVVELYVGKIWIIENGAKRATPFLDIGSKIRPDDEEGLLGLAFHPDYATNGRFFVHYTKAGNGNNVIEEYTRSAANPNVADTTAKLIMEVQESDYANHNGGHLAFGPDGYLYIGLGDGGGADDFLNHAQNATTLHGSLLRIDVDGTAPYTVPAGNGSFGAGAKPEIWAIGLRNPWRYTFDAATGDLYIGDVGQATREEVQVVPSGNGGYNFGWPCYEGTFPFRLNDAAGCPNPGATFRATTHEYDRSTTNGSITGGYVYRGCLMPGWHGTYFFGEFRQGWIGSFVYSGGAATAVTRWGSSNPKGNLDIASPASFGQDHTGELYVLDYGAGANTGRLLKIVPAN